MKVVAIVRDCRDVVASNLELARSAWGGMRFSEQIDSPEKIARRWVKAATLQQQHAARILSLRYEDLVSRPSEELERLGAYFGVDPGRFRPELLRRSRIGRHQRVLTPEELAVVEGIAGEVMSAWGYR
jgi:hypothetical protein